MRTYTLGRTEFSNAAPEVHNMIWGLPRAHSTNSMPVSMDRCSPSIVAIVCVPFSSF